MHIFAQYAIFVNCNVTLNVTFTYKQAYIYISKFLKFPPKIVINFARMHVADCATN